MNTSEIMSAMIFGDGGASKVEELSTDGGSTDAGKVLVVGDNGKIAASDLTVGEGEIALDKTLSVNGAAADAKKTGDAIASLNGSLEELQEGGYVADAQQIQSKINTWLTQHPEATTTVQDVSLTESKFSDALKLKTIKDYVTPQMYGGVGDGSSDDTIAIQSAIDSGKIVYIPDGVYLITSPILSTNRLQLKLSEHAIIRANPTQTIEFLLGLKCDGGAYPSTYGDYISGGTLDGNGKVNTIVGMNFTAMGVVDGVLIKNFLKAGIATRYNTVSEASGRGSHWITNNRIVNRETLNGTIGILDNSSDSLFAQNVIVNAETGMKIQHGATAIANHVWKSDQANFESSVAFKIGGDQVCLSDCVSDTMRVGVYAITQYSRAIIKGLRFYCNSEITPTSYLNTYPVTIFKSDYPIQYLMISDCIVNLNNAQGKIVSDELIGSNTTNICNLLKYNATNAVNANIPPDISTLAKNAMPVISSPGNITTDIINGQITNGIFGGYIVYSDPSYGTFSGWGFVITKAVSKKVTVQSVIVAGQGTKTRRFSDGSWNAFS